ncbi:hypothetical protein HELRODRAFT_191040 [Helobdella robusta]|uniref:Uncharacterized protein n=1 Tax=Helobdella robusta TaxID=6412 RepID=T1FSJ1_HELRO|nr:hypothetical protein HELRODRAFT_191040 [Helobdella robusta]ESO07789.1 hypothetical protein HELRODRAFT_191040 [Helobdella robusta]
MSNKSDFRNIISSIRNLRLIKREGNNNASSENAGDDKMDDVDNNNMDDVENDNNAVNLHNIYNNMQQQHQHNTPTTTVNNGVRILTITRDECGFGFNVRGPMSEGGPMKSLNGELYAPLQYVSAVMERGSAHKSGLLVGDRILEINGKNVEGCSHSMVIEMLKSTVDLLQLTVITPNVGSSSGDLATNSSFNNNNVTDDYTMQDISPQQQLQQQQQLHPEHHFISIPDYQEADNNGDKFIVFNIYLNSRMICCRRYSCFDRLQKILRSHFPSVHFLTLPGKKFFPLNDVQLDNRRRGLERFLVSACSFKDVFNCDPMKQFLNLLNSQPSSFSPSGTSTASLSCTAAEEEAFMESRVMMKFLMPDQSLMEVAVNPDDHTDAVYMKLANHLCLRTDVLPFFALFEITKSGFERKLYPEELPFEMYTNQQQPFNLASCISFNKWLFSKDKEEFICKDPLVTSLIYSQAMESIRNKQLELGDLKEQIKSLVMSGKRYATLQALRTLANYLVVTFPHCQSDSRKRGHVICVVSYDCFKMMACTKDGVLESNVAVLLWGEIEHYELISTSPLPSSSSQSSTSTSSSLLVATPLSSSSSSSLSLPPFYLSVTFRKGCESPRTIKIFSDYSRYLRECFDRVFEERKQASRASHYEQT